MEGVRWTRLIILLMNRIIPTNQLSDGLWRNRGVANEMGFSHHTPAMAGGAREATKTQGHKGSFVTSSLRDFVVSPPF
jgi:hypothetical protein